MEDFADLHNLTEDQRINVIGNYVNTMLHEKDILVIVEDIPGKRERYISKLYEKFTNIEVFAQGNGPTQGCVYFRVRRKR